MSFEITIEPGKLGLQYWKDLWRFRGFLMFLSWRDFLVRYKQTVLGVVWTFLRPFVSMVVLTIVFGKMAGLPSEGGVPYPILVYSGLLPWNFFTTSVTQSTNSMISNVSLISKVYFPKIIIPISSVVVCMVDFCFSFVIFALLMLWYRFIPSWKIIFLPCFVLLTMLLALGIGFILGALNVKHRDVTISIPYLLQLGMFISPVGFSSSIAALKWRYVYSLNPLVGIIDGFRWTVGANAEFYWPSLIISFVITFSIFFFGLRYFRNAERKFADYI